MLKFKFIQSSEDGEIGTSCKGESNEALKCTALVDV